MSTIDALTLAHIHLYPMANAVEQRWLPDAALLNVQAAAGALRAELADAGSGDRRVRDALLFALDPEGVSLQGRMADYRPFDDFADVPTALVQILSNLWRAAHYLADGDEASRAALIEAIDEFSAWMAEAVCAMSESQAESSASVAPPRPGDHRVQATTATLLRADISADILRQALALVEDDADLRELCVRLLAQHGKPGEYRQPIIQICRDLSAGRPFAPHSLARKWRRTLARLRA